MYKYITSMSPHPSTDCVQYVDLQNLSHWIMTTQKTIIIILHISFYLYVWACVDAGCWHSWRSCHTHRICAASHQRHVLSYVHNMTMSECKISHIFHRCIWVCHPLKKCKHSAAVIFKQFRTMLFVTSTVHHEQHHVDYKNMLPCTL